MVKIKNLNFNFKGDSFKLFIEDLFVGQSEILAIIGPNGAGKTTLLNVIAFFEKVKSGCIEVFGREMISSRDKLILRRRMSFVFSQPYLLNDTVYNNISLPLRLRNINDPSRINEMLEFFKITDLKHKRALSLSQGQKHRVALARAFVSRPELILLDEPFLSLEKRYRDSLMNSLRKIIKLNKASAILVTQDQEEALALADTIAVMKDGRILQQGNPEEIFLRPALKEIADFVGVETIIEGRVTGKEDNLCFVKVKDKVLEVVSECRKDDEVFVCIRPEDVLISRESDSRLNSARNNFKAKIIDIEPWKLEYKLSLDCGFKLAAFVTKQSLRKLDLKIGEEVIAAFKATAVHLIKR